MKKDSSKDREETVNRNNTILIVDDDEINRAILENIFSSGYCVEEAENGRIGLEKLFAQTERYCAVLLDVVMPVMDGIEVLKILNEKGTQTEIPVFLITAEADDRILKTAYSLGVMDVIHKPVIPYVVRRRIDSVIELFRARKRLSSKVEEQQSELLKQAEQIILPNMGMVEALSTAIEFRSGESGEHVHRIHDITEYLLRNTELGEGLKEEEIRQIAMAAIMHDVGKIAIPDAILNKPGRLTPEEYEIMKTHTTQGAQLLKKIPHIMEHQMFQYAYDIAEHHHERWDGRGYPDGLKGDEISMWAQIVSLADVYDALVSKRVYKGAIEVEEALRMIRDGECGVFNPKLLKCFMQAEKPLRRLYQ